MKKKKAQTFVFSIDACMVEAFFLGNLKQVITKTLKIQEFFSCLFPVYQVDSSSNESLREDRIDMGCIRTFNYRTMCMLSATLAGRIRTFNYRIMYMLSATLAPPCHPVHPSGTTGAECTFFATLGRQV